MLNPQKDQKIVAHTVKNFYITYQVHPSMRVLIKELKEKAGWDETKANSLYLAKLFPEGPIKQASELANIPKPKKCL